MDHHGSKNTIPQSQTSEWGDEIARQYFKQSMGEGRGYSQVELKQFLTHKTIISVSLYKMLTNTFNNFRREGLNDQKMFQNIQ